MNQQPHKVANRRIGIAIREARMYLGWSEKRLGELLGVTQAAINRREKGTYAFKAADLLLMSEVFEIPIDQLIRLRPGGARDNACLKVKRAKDRLAFSDDNDYV